jgi:prepilin-type N-terminal cleavage/methylation domain-containing protein
MFIARDSTVRKSRRQRGLTLLEIVVGLAVLSMMTGAIYGIVMGSVEAASMLAAVQSEDRRVETFLQRTRTAFAHLPAGATLELKVIESEPLRQELTLRGVHDAFVWGERGGWEKPAVTLAPQRWPDDRVPVPAPGEKRSAAPPAGPRFSLAMTAPDFFRAGADGEPMSDSVLRSRQGHQLLQPDPQGRFWLDLLPDVQRVEWRFYDPAKKVWLEQQPPGRPPLIELRLLLPGRRSPVREIFETA